MAPQRPACSPGGALALPAPTVPFAGFMATDAYADALEFLFPRTTTIKFGLDTTRALLAARRAIRTR